MATFLASARRSFIATVLFPGLIGISSLAGCSKGDADDAAKPSPEASVVSPTSGTPNAKKKFYSTILVDKATNSLELANLQDGEYVTLQKIHATLGKVRGDKEQEGDLKTPEGIYTFTQILKPPALPAKYGIMAFVVNYPNNYDRIAGRTGFGIMLHATNTPD